MKILGIGNAIVDVICKVDEKFINHNGLTKGTMKLIFDDGEFNKMLSSLKIGLISLIFEVGKIKLEQLFEVTGSVEDVGVVV